VVILVKCYFNMVDYQNKLQNSI